MTKVTTAHILPQNYYKTEIDLDLAFKMELQTAVTNIRPGAVNQPGPRYDKVDNLKYLVLSKHCPRILVPSYCKIYHCIISFFERDWRRPCQCHLNSGHNEWK